MILQLGSVHTVLGVKGRILVEVRHENGLAVAGLDVFARTAIAMTASTNFIVEATVDFVLFGAKNGSQKVCHSAKK